MKRASKTTPWNMHLVRFELIIMFIHVWLPHVTDDNKYYSVVQLRFHMSFCID